MSDERYDLEERLLEYAARIIRLTEQMVRSPAGLHIAQQIMRSGTSPLPNHGEAQAAESKRDFIHKMKICLKELRETHRWLRLIQRVPLIKTPQRVDPLLQETDELVRRTLEELPSKDRELLRMVFYEDIDRADICRNFRISPQYLRVLVHRAKARLREYWLERHGEALPSGTITGASDQEAPRA